MKVKINGKWIEGRFEKGRFEIPLTDEEDVKFFYKWEKKKRLPKADYVEDIECKGICELILLKNCSPILSINEDYVTLNYDSFKIIEVYE